MATRTRKPGDEQEEERGGTMTGEFNAGPVAGTALRSGVTFARKALQYAEIDGLAVFEGDIILGTVQEVRAAAEAAGMLSGTARAQHKAASDAIGIAGRGATPADMGPVLASIGITGAQFRWPNATIPFEIDPALPNQQRVTDAIAHWHANTRIRFVARGSEANFVRFVPGGGCSSNVGMRGGMQQVTLGGGCTTGNAIHEIGHTVGLWHEQSREDRDTFVQIVWANIDPAMQHNFDQHIADGDDLGAYDYGSIMHYPATAFSINGQATIIPLQPLPPGVVMGQRNGLSAGDIAGVHMMYPAPHITIKEVRKDPIRDTIKELAKDPIRDTFKEIRKDPILDGTVKEIRKDPIFDPKGFDPKGFDPKGFDPKGFDPKGFDPKGFDPKGFDPKGFDPGPFPGPIPGGGPFGFDAAGGGVPFVLGSPSRAGAGGYGGMGMGGMADAVAAAAEQVRQLGEAMAVVDRQHAELAAAYDAAVAALDELQRGGGIS